MKILVTGASGFFGKHLLAQLKKNKSNFEVMYTGHNANFFMDDPRFAQRKIDLHDENHFKELMSSFQPTHMVHLAWFVSPGDFWDSEENVKWLYSSINLFKEFCKNGGKFFIGAGTLAEYDWSKGVLDEENTLLNPSTLYGQCKKSLCEIICKYRNAYFPETKIIWPRIGYFFGPGEPKEKLISKIIYNLENNAPIDLATRDFSRSYAHVKYLTQVMEICLFKDWDTDFIFNLSSEYLYRLEDMINFVTKILSLEKVQANYGIYKVKPETLKIRIERMNNLGVSIEDTFFHDLEEFMLKEI